MTDEKRPDETVPEEPIESQAAPEVESSADQEPTAEESAKDEPAKEEPAKEEPAKEEPAKEEPAKDEAAPLTVIRARRRRDPLAAALIGVLTLLLGFAFAVQVRSADEDQQLAGAREEDLVRILDDLDAQEARLRAQLADQRAQLADLTDSDSQAAAALRAAREQAEAIGILNGTVAAQGPGLEMVIRDPDDAVRVADVLDAIQELRGAGAETMQIDGIRVGVSTAVTGQAGDLMLDGRPITAPYEFVVIGDPQGMETALNIPGGVVQDMTRLGGSVAITQSDLVVVDALRPLDEPQYAAPVTDD